MEDLTALAQRVWASFLGRCVHRFIRMEGIDRCLVLSSQAFTALIPLLIVVSTLAPPGGAEVIARTVITKFGLTGSSAASVEQLFAVEGTSQSALGAGSALLLLYSGVSFTRRLQRMYRAAWDQEKAGFRGNLFAGLALVVLLAEALVLYGIMSLVTHLPESWLLALPLSVLTGLVPWITVPYLLLNRQLHWRRLLVTGAVTASAMTAYGTATTVYMPDTIENYTSGFGLFGVTIAIIGWLLGAAGIVVASAVTGAEFDRSGAAWVLRLKQRFRLSDPDLPQPSGSHPDEVASLTSADLVLFARVVWTWLVMAGAVWLATAVVPGISVDGGLFTYLWVSLLLGLVNALIGPVLRLVVGDLTWPSLGVVAMGVNGSLLEITSWLSKDIATAGLGSSLLGALVISAAIAAYELVVRPFHPHGMNRDAVVVEKSGADNESD